MAKLVCHKCNGPMGMINAVSLEPGVAVMCMDCAELLIMTEDGLRTCEDEEATGLGELQKAMLKMVRMRIKRSRSMAIAMNN